MYHLELRALLRAELEAWNNSGVGPRFRKVRYERYRARKELDAAEADAVFEEERCSDSKSPDRRSLRQRGAGMSCARLSAA